MATGYVASFWCFLTQNTELEETNNQTKSGLIHFQQKMWSVGFRLKRKLGHMMMVSGYLLQNWDSRQDLVSPGLGVTNLTSEKWRGEELGSESSLRAGEGKGMRIVRGWHGTTFYLAHQSNINELMTSQGGTHQYLATLRSGHNLVSDVRINSSGGECCHQPFRVQSKLWGNRKNKLLLITVNMWQRLTYLRIKRQILKKEEKLHLTRYQILHRINFPPVSPV